jgi:transcriptional regulator with XRE-family HTH domain
MGFYRDMTGRQLRAFRKWLGLTQQQLADILGVQRVSVARAEIGKYRKNQEANPEREISRLLRMLIDQALQKGAIKLSVLSEARGDYGDVLRKSLNDIGLSVVRERHAEYGEKPRKKSVKRPPKGTS